VIDEVIPISGNIPIITVMPITKRDETHGAPSNKKLVKFLKKNVQHADTIEWNIGNKYFAKKMVFARSLKTDIAINIYDLKLVDGRFIRHGFSIVFTVRKSLIFPRIMFLYNLDRNEESLTFALAADGRCGRRILHEHRTFDENRRHIYHKFVHRSDAIESIYVSHTRPISDSADATASFNVHEYMESLEKRWKPLFKTITLGATF
jgi:hypothetical protein